MAEVENFVLTVGSWTAAPGRRWGYNPTRTPAVGSIVPTVLTVGTTQVTPRRFFFREENGNLLVGAQTNTEYDALEGLWAEMTEVDAELSAMRFQSGHLTVIWTGSGLAFNERWVWMDIDGGLTGQFGTVAATDTAAAITSFQGSAALPADGTTTAVELRATEDGDALWSGTITWGTSGSRRGFAASSFGQLDPIAVDTGDGWGPYVVELPTSGSQNSPSFDVPDLPDDTSLADGEKMLVRLHDTNPDPPAQVEVPDVVGESEADARATLTGDGFTVSVVYSNVTSGTDDEVISQDPAAGEDADSGSEVEITVRNLQAVVPDVADQDRATAIANVQAAGFTTVTTSQNVTTGTDDTVLRTVPAIGTQADYGSQVNIVLRNLQVTVPDLDGLTRSAAEAAITAANLQVGAVTTVTVSDAAEDGLVQTQTPAAGATADAGDLVAFTLGSYTAPQVAVPDVVGDSQADAETAITGAGLVAAVSATTTSTTDSTLDGTVASQDPASGTMVDSGSTVTITLYEHMAAQVAVPTLVGLTEAAAETALTTAGLVKGTVTTMTVTDAAQNGLVQSSTPTVGTMVDSGSSVALVIGNYVAPTPTPTTGGLVHVTTLEVVDTGGWIGWDASSTTYDGSSIGDASFTFDGTDIVLTRVDWNQTNEQIRIWAETAAQMTALVGEAWFILAWPVQDRDVSFQLAATGVGTRGHKENAYPNGTVVEGIDATSTAPATVDLYVYSGDNPRGRIDGPYWVV